MNLRGRYEGGGAIVTAERWWSPRARKSARLAARVLEHHMRRAQMHPEVRAAWDEEARAMNRQRYGHAPR